ncbi:Ku protein [Streptomyces angustmyceticus]|uniref:Ku protein n=1 Tax=Streptomyces angustmyceticus TaxID=285578 RepID=UPI0038109548
MNAVQSSGSIPRRRTRWPVQNEVIPYSITSKTRCAGQPDPHLNRLVIAVESDQLGTQWSHETLVRWCPKKRVQTVEAALALAVLLPAPAGSSPQARGAKGLYRPVANSRGSSPYARRGRLVKDHQERHAVDGGRVRHRRVCELDGREVRAEETARGWEAPDGRTVVIQDADLEALPLLTKRVIEVVGFIDETDVDPLLYARLLGGRPRLRGSEAVRPPSCGRGTESWCCTPCTGPRRSGTPATCPALRRPPTGSWRSPSC